MDLPIDHFRLLGVSPSAEPAAILRRLQTRIESPPDQGFTHEALLQRSNLLQRSADLLIDPAERASYEEALLRLSESHPNETVGLDLPGSSEVAGLILLWEAHGALEAFQLARQGLQPPQAPALGSGREADLTLLAALACLDASVEEQGQRRYESAAQLLADGIELQQRMGKMPEQQRRLEQELETLLPYRILDLLSRDLSESDSHQQGLLLLNQLVSGRGGLDLHGDSAEAGQLNQEDFESFFQQIRRFLTVQEQIDLFSRWSEAGEVEAGFLTVLSLTAAGFSRRKPEFLEQARERLKDLPPSELDPMPLLGSLDLLLGNVREAERHFASIRDAEVQAWFVQHPGDNLAAQCEYCRAWLERDVLPGYRDVDATGVDLDAWFADRDVQHYVDRLDRQTQRQPMPSEQSAPWESLQSMDLPLDEDADHSEVADPEAENPEHPSRAGRWHVILLVAGLAAVVLIAAAVLLSRRQASQSPDLPPPAATPSQPEPPSETEALPPPTASLKPERTSSNEIKPVTADQPSQEELQMLVQGWLDGKSAAMAGEEFNLASVARNPLVEDVRRKRAADAADGLIQTIDASVTSVDVVSRTASRIELRAQVAYSDRTLNKAGTVVDRTPPRTFTVTYIFGRDGKQWKLHAYIPGS